MSTMTSRLIHRTAAVLLGSTAIVTLAVLPPAHAAGAERTIILAQGQQPAQEQNNKKQRPPKEAPAAKPAETPKPPASTAQPKPTAPQPPKEPTTAQPNRQAPTPPTTERRQREKPQTPPAAQRQDRERDKPQTPPAAQRQERERDKPQTPPAAQRQERERDKPQTPPAAERRERERDKPQTPPAAQQQQRGSTTEQHQAPTPSTAEQPRRGASPPAAQQQNQQSTPPTAQQPQRGAAPTAQQPATTTPAAENRNPAAVTPPTQPRDAKQFIRRDNSQPAPHIDQLRQERRETREGNRTIIRENDRTIIREDNRTIIRHNETDRFVVGARAVHTERRGGNSETIIERGNGIRIINVTDADGRLIRRVRRDPGGREIVIIDNSFALRRGTVPLFVQLPPPVIRIPRERYILDLGVAAAAAPTAVYGVLMEPPVETIDQPYTVEQVRFSAPLRDRMPRVDLDINFETGSWQLTPDQVERLAVIADAINRAVQANPREVFMIEGHTDAVGNEVDNLSLSDRRAEAVAVALTEQFHVPPENLVTQGYGEQVLKVPNQGPERANRRVAVRRITPLIDQQANAAPPRR